MTPQELVFLPRPFCRQLQDQGYKVYMYARDWSDATNVTYQVQGPDWWDFNGVPSTRYGVRRSDLGTLVVELLS